MRKRTKNSIINNKISHIEALYHLRKAQEENLELLQTMLQFSPTLTRLTEYRLDYYISGLRRILDGKGAELEIRAKFPNATINIGHFRDISRLKPF